MTPGRPFQILALDGGGYRGLFSAALLAAFEEDLERPVVEHFDLVTGTSTSGIIALALGAGLSPREVIEFYETHGPKIFARSWLRRFRRPVRAKSLGAVEGGAGRSVRRPDDGTEPRAPTWRCSSSPTRSGRPPGRFPETMYALCHIDAGVFGVRVPVALAKGESVVRVTCLDRTPEVAVTD